MLDGLYVQLFGALLFCVVFLFLWRQSSVVYFGYWALAWGVESLAWVCTWLARATDSSRWLAAHSLLEFGFALSLVAAARAGSEPAGRAWRSSLRILSLFPVFLLALELIGWNHDWFQVIRSLVLSAIYWYSFRQLGFGARRLFQIALAALSLLYLQNAAAYGYLVMTHGLPPLWMSYLKYLGFYDVALKTLLAFSAMGMWIESQSERLEQLGNELDRVRRESAHDTDLDFLTGLHNQTSLRRLLDSDEPFHGVAAVCDLDAFKSINDRFGHLVGDEVLRNVGNLLRSSVRAEDQAYRWGGDEFTILFRDRGARLARSRMREIEARLSDFRIRGHGAIRIQFSWGVAEGSGEPLRVTVGHADHEMYAAKRAKAASKDQSIGTFPPTTPEESAAV